MSWNPGSYRDPATYPHMVRVLPTFPPGSSSQNAQLSNPGRISGNNGFPQNHKVYSSPQIHRTMSLSVKQDVPRIPPPPPQSPRRARVSNQPLGRLENKNVDFYKSVQNLNQTGNTSMSQQQSNGLLHNGFYEKRSMHSSLFDLRDVANTTANPQQLLSTPSAMRAPVSAPSSNRLSINVNNHQLQQVSSPSLLHYQKQYPPDKPTSSHFSVPTALPPMEASSKQGKIKQSGESEMNSLHDEMIKLSRELALMRDPMKEHEEWLQNQSAQVKELEELQKQLQNSMQVGTQRQRKLASTNPFNQQSAAVAPPSSDMKQSSLAPKAKPTIVPPSTTDFRPPITSPKPKLQSSKNSAANTSTKATQSFQQEIVKNSAQQLRKTMEVPKQDTNVHSTGTTKPAASTNAKVRRISKLYEANDSSGKDNSVMSKNPAKSKSGTGTIGKLSPALLQSLQGLKPPQQNISARLLQAPSVKEDEERARKSKTPSPEISNAFQSDMKPVLPIALSAGRGRFSASTENVHTSIPLTKPCETTVKQSPPSSSSIKTIPPALPASPRPKVNSSNVSQFAMKQAEFSSVSPPPAKSIVKSSAPPPSLKPTEILNSPPAPKLPPVVPPASMKPTHFTTNGTTSAFDKTSAAVEMSQAKSPLIPSVTIPAPTTLSTTPTQPPLDFSDRTGSDTISSTKHNTKSSDILSSVGDGALRYENIPHSNTQHEALSVPGSSEAIDHHTPISISTEDQKSFHRYENIPDDESIANEASGSTHGKLSTIASEQAFPRRGAPADQMLTSSASFGMPAHSHTVPNLHVPASTLARPTTPPPPPPNVSPQNSRPNKNSTQSLPVSTSSPSTEDKIPMPPPLPSPEVPQTPTLSSHSSGIPENVSTRRSSSSNSSFSSLPGMPLSPAEVSSKANLMEQIRQFRQSGRNLKRTSSEIGESNGTPTRTRKDSMHEALQTRFQAFCGNQSDSSDDNDVADNDDDDDWE